MALEAGVRKAEHNGANAGDNITRYIEDLIKNPKAAAKARRAAYLAYGYTESAGA